MPMDRSRIQGFGSDGGKKVWHCPAGHHLQPRKATAGKCDGCKRCVASGDAVMECRQCNWYLCAECHPQEQEKHDWFWGSINQLIETAQQEIADITDEFKEMADEFESLCDEVSQNMSCGVTSASQYKSEEIRFDALGNAGAKRSKKADVKRQPSATLQERKESGVGEPQAAVSKKEGKEGKEEEVEAGEQVRTPQAAAAATKHEEVDKEAAIAGATPAEEPAKPPAQPMAEDLMDFGQHDLLDLDIEPQIVTSTKPRPREVAGAGSPLDLLLFDEPTISSTPAGSLPLIDFAPTFTTAVKVA